MGIVSVVLWETLFPARRDAFVLTPLPVPLPVQMLGRLLGLAAFCGLFIILLNGIPAIAFPIVTAAGFLEMPRGIVAHFVSTTAADLFVFFGITSLQGLVILGFGRRVSARLASVAQAGTVLTVLLVLLFFGSLRELTRDAIVRNDPQDPFLLFNPAAWFLGLYEFIAGTPRPIMSRLALLGTTAAIVPAAITAATYAFGYQRLLKRAVETPSRSTRFLPARIVSRVVRWTFVRKPEEQAICAFLIRAISRSGRHSLLLSIYVGASLALMITFVLPDIIRLGPSALATPTLGVLALPLVLSAGLSVGIRILITIPAEMPAR